MNIKMIGAIGIFLGIIAIITGILLQKKFKEPYYSFSCFYRSFREIFTMRGFLYFLGFILIFLGIFAVIISSLLLL